MAARPNLMQFGDTTLTKVFVGGLAWETESETLGRLFGQFGEILEAVVITDKNTGRSKGYGFVTFRDPEAARRACFNPNPVIDGRSTNCNLASIGRPTPLHGYPYLPPLHGNYSGRRPIYHQPLLPYRNQLSFAYPPPPPPPPLPYGYSAYGSDHVYPQGAYNSYVGQQYLQMYGLPGTVGSAIYPYGQLPQPISGNHGYTTGHAYAVPSNQIVQFSGPSVNELTTAPIPTIQAPYPTIVAAPAPTHTQIVTPSHSRIPTDGSASRSDQTAS